MKIFYAIQATGNGHLSRAQQLYPYLQKFGEVDFFVSGNNGNLPVNLPIKYQSKGCSLHYSKCGGLNFWELTKNIKPLMLWKDAKALPLEKYDVIINDFDVVTALACKLKKLHSVQLGHQASFQSDATPRPSNISFIGETILKHYAKASKHIGFHFEKYDSFIFPPVIKEEFINAIPTDLKHITVYLPSYQRHCLLETFNKLTHIDFHWFLPDTKTVEKIGNITYHPIDQNLFNRSLISCHGIITGGGFETPAEALYLGKKLISIPIKNHYEQQCNAAALRRLGIIVLDEIDDDFSTIVANWYEARNEYVKMEANNIKNTLQYLFDTYPSTKDKQFGEELANTRYYK